MRRIRSSEPGGHVLLEATGKSRRGRKGWGIRIEVDHQVAVDADVRKLLDRLRLELGDALRGRSTPNLEPTWGLAPITGTPSQASTAIELTNRTAASYLERNVDAKVDEVTPRVLREWLAASVAPGDGVDTEAAPNLQGGPLPQNTKR